MNDKLHKHQRQDIPSRISSSSGIQQNMKEEFLPEAMLVEKDVCDFKYVHTGFKIKEVMK